MEIRKYKIRYVLSIIAISLVALLFIGVVLLIRSEIISKDVYGGFGILFILLFLVSFVWASDCHSQYEYQKKLTQKHISDEINRFINKFGVDNIMVEIRKKKLKKLIKT